FDGLEVAAIVLRSDMLEHADRVDAVEWLVELAVVLDADLDGQAAAQLAGVLRLFLGYGDADAADAVALGRMLEGLAPSATDVEDAHPRLQAELATDEVQLRFLGSV